MPNLVKYLAYKKFEEIQKVLYGCNQKLVSLKTLKMSIYKGLLLGFL